MKTDWIFSGLESELAHSLGLLWVGIVVAGTILGLVALLCALCCSKDNMHLPLLFGIFGLVCVFIYIKVFKIDVSDPPAIHALAAGIPFLTSACAIVLAIIRAGCRSAISE